MNQNKFVCPNCGTELELNSLFCPKCGNKNALINQELNQQMNSSQVQNKEQIINNNLNNLNFSQNQQSQGNNYATSVNPIKQEFNWSTIGGIACGIIAIFIFWWLSIVGIIIEIKALKDIKIKNQKGKIFAYFGLASCCADIMYIIFCLVEALL